ncbi:MAG: flagellar hook assembly protein FlgD [Gammaproteobacteria bacterium]|nr:flagellar hook assembly protein FlgD [Gammaproteobacteria bacterium]
MINNNTQTLDQLGFRSQRDLAIKDGPSDKLGQEDFLKLMTTQLKNQDPMKPMENGEFLSQMAQFGTVSGIQDLQESFASLSESLYSNQAFQAAGLVGRSVMTASGSGVLGAAGGVQGAIEVPSASSDVNVSIYDESGQLVRTINMGTQLSGQQAFSWDGLMDDGSRAPAGAYLLRAQASYGDKTESLEVLTNSEVDSVNLNPGGSITLNLSGGRSADFSEVRKIM